MQRRLKASEHRGHGTGGAWIRCKPTDGCGSLHEIATAVVELVVGRPRGRRRDDRGVHGREAGRRVTQAPCGAPCRCTGWAPHRTTSAIRDPGGGRGGRGAASVHARRRPSRYRPGSVRLNPSCPNDALRDITPPEQAIEAGPPRTPPGPTAPPWTRWANGPSRPVTRRRRGRGIRCSAWTTGDRVRGFRADLRPTTRRPVRPVRSAGVVRCPRPSGAEFGGANRRFETLRTRERYRGIACRKNVGRTLAACTLSPWPRRVARVTIDHRSCARHSTSHLRLRQGRRPSPTERSARRADAHLLRGRAGPRGPSAQPETPRPLPARSTTVGHRLPGRAAARNGPASPDRRSCTQLCAQIPARTVSRCSAAATCRAAS